VENELKVPFIDHRVWLWWSNIAVSGWLNRTLYAGIFFLLRLPVLCRNPDALVVGNPIYDSTYERPYHFSRSEIPLHS